MAASLHQKWMCLSMGKRVKFMPDLPKDLWSETVQARIDYKEAVYYMFRTE
jgi:hypothetical protein